MCVYVCLRWMGASRKLGLEKWGNGQCQIAGARAAPEASRREVLEVLDPAGQDPGDRSRSRHCGESVHLRESGPLEGRLCREVGALFSMLLSPWVGWGSCVSTGAKASKGSRFPPSTQAH